VQLDVEVGGEIALEAAHRLGADVLIGEDGREADAPTRLRAGPQEWHGERAAGGGQDGAAADLRWHGRSPFPITAALRLRQATVSSVISLINSYSQKYPRFYEITALAQNSRERR
jgi:hypothetical protein